MKGRRFVRTKDPDVLALVATCKALERHTSAKALRATLDFVLSRYVWKPPEKSWWRLPDGKRPR